MFTFNLLCLHAVLFTITLHSILIVFCIYILSLHNDNVLTITITLHYNNDYSERPCLHTVLSVTITLSSILTLLFTYVILFTMDIFSQLLHNWHYTNVCSISSTYTYNTVWNTLPSIMTLLSPTVLFTITLPSIVSVLFTYAFLFSMWIFVKTLLYNCYIKCLHWIFTVTYGTVYNYSPQYTYFAVYICFPFHNANIFPQLLYNFLFHYVYSEASFDTCSTVTISLCFVYTYFPFHNDNV